MVLHQLVKSNIASWLFIARIVAWAGLPKQAVVNTFVFWLYLQGMGMEDMFCGSEHAG